MDLDPKQIEAVNACLDTKRRIVAVTGSAGTGKTSLIKYIAERMGAAGYSVAVACPTGKAAKRVFEATGIRAQTIHRLLKFPHPGERDEKTGKPLDTTLPTKCRADPLEHDFILIDEYAMVPHSLHRQIIDAMKPGSGVRVFGDLNQLPPIESSDRLRALPTPFNDLLTRFQGIRLDVIHRQGEGSGVVSNGARIISGWSPTRTDDFNMIVTNDAVDAVINTVLVFGEKGIDFSTVDNQVITPQNTRWIGTHALNAKLQMMYRPEMDGWYNLPRHPWAKPEESVRIHVGDKVVCTQNNYEIGSNVPEISGMFNGETGIVTEISEYGEVLIDLGDRIVNVPPEIIVERGERRYGIKPLMDIQLAYALTTHKCQGSEYSHIVYVMNKSVRGMLNRKNFYTAVTRARKTATVVTDIPGLSAALSTVAPRF
jgi:exodeoxyribonuclease V alpha subunit